ncbi:protein Hook homolog 1-like [Gadus macrocephalus]|uniref:protein Hook homolog 1-like n=1 Tax=Gadus macrocephalus TaxID=80720 RepID=UPI0028CB6363|nr:protein Hook homolog 1-like [Gadus macrocephalus]
MMSRRLSVFICVCVCARVCACMPMWFRLEAAKDDYRIHCEELEKQLIEVQHCNDGLTGLAEESRALKDELDILRSVPSLASVHSYYHILYHFCACAFENRVLFWPAGREKFIRLQHENKMLRLQQEEFEREKISDLQTQLEESHRTRSELDTDNRLSRERMAELQQQGEDLQKALQSQAAQPDDSNLKRKLDAHMVQLNEAQDEIMKKELLEDLQPDNTQTSLRLDELMAALKKKDDDMKAMEERYKMYLEKARNVIRALDPKLNPATAEIQALKSLVLDRDSHTSRVERECEQAKLREYEEKLIVMAWYNKSLSFHKLAMQARLGDRSASSLPLGPSFLSQQRQVTNATRRILPVNMPASTTK